MGYRYVKSILLGYLVIISIGALLLYTPFAQKDDISLIDTLFTSASAACVTGLIVVSTPDAFTHFGQAVILALIQIGGIGYMSIVTLFFLFAKNNLHIEEKRVVKESLDLPDMKSTGSFIKKIFIIVFGIELVGALILGVRFMQDFEVSKALWYGLFHSISAFNNAGFALFNDSLISYNKDTLVLMTISLLIVIGGIGYFVLIEVFHTKKRFKDFSIHTKIMLYGTSILIVSGMLLFMIMEYNNPATLGNMSMYDKLLNSLFLSINFRTSGFNSLDFSAFKDISLFMSTIFMMIGGGQGGTAGGIKVTTFAVLAITIIYTLKDNQHQEPNIFKRTIEQKVINKALTIILGASVFVLMMSFVLAETQQAPLIKIIFEVVSAFATVGLSVGNGGVASLSANFDMLGKAIIILTMVAGKIGIFAFGFVLIGADKAKHKYIKYPKGRILI